MDKIKARLRRARSTRARQSRLKAVRLSVHRSNCHIYAQIFDISGARVLASASTLEPEVRSLSPNGGCVGAAVVVGKLLAERALKAGIGHVAFDRSGYKYHGRVKALAEAAREGGLQF
ncbi:MAG: hypothetical protein AMXMBFR6_23180 [Betaproteobacteria bacterium]|jgi:large subunit ribosomal protein L18|nr:hypothetical protein [Rhodocyclaceae bacterium]